MDMVTVSQSASGDDMNELIIMLIDLYYNSHTCRPHRLSPGLESIVANSDARADLKSDLRGFGFYSLGISKDRT